MSKTYRLGLLGYPLQGSRSPALHNAALKAAGLAGEYRLYPVEAGDIKRMEQLLARLRNGELHGLSVTIPHKQTVIPLLDSLTETARAIGAVNTIYFRNGRLVGENTDAPGFMADLQKQNISGKACLVLGAGGAARAVISQLKSAGWQVTVAARRTSQAEALASEFGLAGACRLGSPITQDRYDLIVNTTPLGMIPNQASCPWEGDFPPGAFVYDLVYKPPETILMQKARAAGLRTCNGLGMLLEQAMLAFELWTGHPASREAMLEVIA